MQKRFPAAKEAAPPPQVQHAIDGMMALLAGERRDLADVAIDNDGVPEFNTRVYAIVRKVPPGQTITYGEIAERLGDKLLARAVGQAMGENRCPIVMPCHRVLAASGKSGGFSALGRRRDQIETADHRRRAAGRADFVRRAAARSAQALDGCVARNSPDPFVARTMHGGKQQTGHKRKVVDEEAELRLVAGPVRRPVEGKA